MFEREKNYHNKPATKKVKQTKQTWYNRKTAEHVTCLHKGQPQAWPSLIQTIQRKQTSRKRDWIFQIILLWLWWFGPSKLYSCRLYPGWPYSFVGLSTSEACSPFYLKISLFTFSFENWLVHLCFFFKIKKVKLGSIKDTDLTSGCEVQSTNGSFLGYSNGP